MTMILLFCLIAGVHAHQQVAGVNCTAATYEKAVKLERGAIERELIEHLLASDEALSKVQAIHLEYEGFVHSDTECMSASGRERVATIKSLFDSTCWYSADWRKILGLLRNEGFPMSETLPVHLCDGDCNTYPTLGSLEVSKSRRIVYRDLYGQDSLLGDSSEVHTPEPRRRIRRRRLDGDAKKKMELKTTTLLPLNVKRHFGAIAEALADNSTFVSKLPKAIWRGATTGRTSCWLRGTTLDRPEHMEWDFDSDTEGCARWNLVVRWGRSTSEHVDVGISKWVQVQHWHKETFQLFEKSAMRWQDMLQYRYLVSVEGNDVATNMKWALASNSVVLMPSARVETFFGEGMLKPYVHYVPLREDVKDLEQKVLWCEAHLDKCEAISKRASDYVRQFASINEVYILGARVLQRHIEFISSARSCLEMASR
jgi:hypothetical protein